MVEVLLQTVSQIIGNPEKKITSDVMEVKFLSLKQQYHLSLYIYINELKLHKLRLLYLYDLIVN